MGVVTVMTPRLIVRVDALLTVHQWSPEQISGILNSDEDTMKVSHEILDLHIWVDKRAAGKLLLHLRQRRK
jgi:IS30 family transposase